MLMVGALTSSLHHSPGWRRFVIGALPIRAIFCFCQARHGLQNRASGENMLVRISFFLSYQTDFTFLFFSPATDGTCPAFDG